MREPSEGCYIAVMSPLLALPSLAAVLVAVAAPVFAAETGGAASAAGPQAPRMECYRSLLRTASGANYKLGPDLVAVIRDDGLYLFSSRGGAFTPRAPGETQYLKVEGAELPYLRYQNAALAQSRDAEPSRAYQLAKQDYTEDSAVLGVLDQDLIRRLGTLPARHEREERELANESRGQFTRLPASDDDAYRAALNSCRAVGGSVAEAAGKADEQLAAAAAPNAAAPKRPLNVPLERYGEPR